MMWIVVASSAMSSENRSDLTRHGGVDVGFAALPSSARSARRWRRCHRSGVFVHAEFARVRPQAFMPVAVMGAVAPGARSVVDASQNIVTEHMHRQQIGDGGLPLTDGVMSRTARPHPNRPPARCPGRTGSDRPASAIRGWPPRSRS